MTVPRSLEVVAEEFYDAAAWLRDLDLGELPADFIDLALTVHYPVVATLQNVETEEVTVEEVAVEIVVKRFDDGKLHVHGPGVCANIDMDALKEKRP
jgi:hypothetical protein